MSDKETMRTRSIWGSPDPRIYRFLDILEGSGLLHTLCVLGCADGAEVLPAAKRGFLVCAVDVDGAALYGGQAKIGSRTVELKGLAYWAKKLRLKDKIEIIKKDLMDFDPIKTYSGVFISGVVHYSENSRYSIEEIAAKIKSLISPGGILLWEYIHRSERNNDPSRHFLTYEEVQRFFDKPDWRIRSNKVKTYVDNPNPRNPIVHEIVWGRLYATRKEADK